jgi:hypothetical protein
MGFAMNQELAQVRLADDAESAQMMGHRVVKV